MLMNVSMNVVTYFCMGENFLLKDKEFIHIADMVKEGMSYHFTPQRHQVIITRLARKNFILVVGTIQVVDDLC